jgi:threonine dehydratase
MTEVSFETVKAAAKRLEGHVVRTPLIKNAALDTLSGGNLYVKPETLQHGGSFKARGAFNRLLQMNEAERAAGVVAWSSGNHAQGVAFAARELGIAATIVMPTDAPQIKLERTRSFGATIVTYDRFTESREEIASDLANRTGAVLVPSYDDHDVISGQGSIGVEVAEDFAAMGESLDALIVCCGGGGLTAGISLALSGLSPATKIYTAEPEGFDDTARSLAGGERVANDPAARSICDALLAPEPGHITFGYNKRFVEKGLVVSDDEVRAAIRFALFEMKLLVEPGGAVALASVLSGKIDLKGLNAAIIMSGGNIDPAMTAAIAGDEHSA